MDLLREKNDVVPERTASICCLRTLLDSACEEGTMLARQDEMCPSVINTLDGGLRKKRHTEYDRISGNNATPEQSAFNP
ncbi:hypothetical protein DICVIV_05397 [Dictyocaulus viviparus]|uniref:Uncharacterized protein n=1 Tax=Dictyocaulus viviparus TaxID=29172 RepID=A0A0D8Y1K7_DICVI|nr:hypothetical protein DICVIV_05397 [Dictyocaulus viviparus]